MNKPGASVTWTVDVPKKGPYTLYIGYGVPGKDADATLAVNGDARPSPVPLKNYANAKDGEWDKGWTRSFTWITSRRAPTRSSSAVVRATSATSTSTGCG